MPYLSQKSGKTLHLLKSGSKAHAGGNQRKKVELKHTFTEYVDSKKKP